VIKSHPLAHQVQDDAFHEIQLNGKQLVDTVPNSDTITVFNSNFVNGSGGEAGSIVLSTDEESITIPSDGDGPGIKAADVYPAFEGLQDGVAYLQNTRGAYQLVGIHVTNNAALSTIVTTSAAVQTLGGFSNAQIGDVVETNLSSSVELTTTGSAGIVAVFTLVEYINAFEITSPSAATAQAEILVAVANTFNMPFSITSATTIETPGPYTSKLYGAATESGGCTTTIQPSLICVQKLWRPC